nr:hypothetical protein [Novosphingobium guangzhouense]
MDAHVDRLVMRAVRHFVENALLFPEDQSGPTNKAVAQRRRADAARSTFEQPAVQCLFELVHAPCERRLRDAEIARRLPEAAGFVDRNHALQFDQVHERHR